MKFEHTKCNICERDITRFIGKRCSPDKDAKLETNIVQCLYCGLMYPNPMPRPENDRLQANFSNPEIYFSEKVNNKRIKKCEEIMKVIEKEKADRGLLLDVGCGRGELVHVAAKNKWHAVGTELSESFAHYAKDKFGIDVLIGDIINMSLPNENFDVIVLNSVIQYVQDPLGTLRKIYSLLKKEGLLYIEVTNEDALVFKVQDIFKNIVEKEKITTHLSPLFPSFQIYGFNKKSISEALKKSSFRVSSIKIKGLKGGGEVKVGGFGGKVLNFLRRIIISISGTVGRGHLIYCLARK